MTAFSASRVRDEVLAARLRLATVAAGAVAQELQDHGRELAAAAARLDGSEADAGVLRQLRLQWFRGATLHIADSGGRILLTEPAGRPVPADQVRPAPPLALTETGARAGPPPCLVGSQTARRRAHRGGPRPGFGDPHRRHSRRRPGARRRAPAGRPQRPRPRDERGLRPRRERPPLGGDRRWYGGGDANRKRRPVARRGDGAAARCSARRGAHRAARHRLRSPLRARPRPRRRRRAPRRRRHRHRPRCQPLDPRAALGARDGGGTAAARRSREPDRGFRRSRGRSPRRDPRGGAVATRGDARGARTAHRDPRAPGRRAHAAHRGPAREPRAIARRGPGTARRERSRPAPADRARAHLAPLQRPCRRAPRHASGAPGDLPRPSAGRVAELAGRRRDGALRLAPSRPALGRGDLG